LSAYIDIYCERLGPGLLAEPVNASTNAALFAAAAVLAWQAQRRGQLDRPIALLLAIMVAIGIGSTLFHTFATLWARVLDEVPILLFQLAYLWIYARRVIGLGRTISLGMLAAFLAVALYARQFPHLLNGSLVYAPALAVTSALGAFHARTVRCRRWTLLAATGVLLMAVWARTVDAAVCERFPLGTHFLWHLAVALVLYLSMRALLDARRERPEASVAARH
jgi:hypothetical protein